jgi:uncharacterized spore protein YtfJ
MENVESLVKTTLGEIEKILSTKTVVGEPVVVDGKTIIPLISVVLPEQARVRQDGTKEMQEGGGGRDGGGAGVRPIAASSVIRAASASNL